MARDPVPPSLRDRFSFRETLGAGATARVHRVHDRQLEREVALKLLAAPKDPRRRERFVREAAALARVKHENVLRVLDYGLAPEGPYLVTELLEGASMDAFPEGADLDEAMLGVARGLAAVHQAGLLHRDLKPGNMFRCRDGTGVLLDFGLAFDPERTPMTRPGKLVGTMGFMSPEVVGGYSPTPASDWFSWAVTYFLLAEGRPPFTPEQMGATLAGVPLPPPEFEALPVEGPVAQLLSELLRQDPEERPLDLARLEAALAAGRFSSAETAPMLERVATEPRRAARARGWVLGPLSVVVALAGLAWALGKLPGAHPPPAPPPLPAPAPPEPLEELPETEAMLRAREELSRIFGAAAPEMEAEVPRARLVAHLEEVLPGLRDPRLSLKWRRFLGARVEWHRVVSARGPEALRGPAYRALRREVDEGLPQNLLRDLSRLRDFTIYSETLPEQLPSLAEGPEAAARKEDVLARFDEVLDVGRTVFADLEEEVGDPPEELLLRAELALPGAGEATERTWLRLVDRLHAGGEEELRVARAAAGLGLGMMRVERTLVCRTFGRVARGWVAAARRWGTAPAPELLEALAMGAGSLYRTVTRCGAYLEEEGRAAYRALLLELERRLPVDPGGVAETLGVYLADQRVASFLEYDSLVRTELEAMERLQRKAARMARP